MVFSSTIFLFCFLPAVLICYYNPFFKGRKFKNILLLLSSLLFYAWGEPVFVFIMMLSTVINWLAGLLIDRQSDKHKRKLVLVLAVIYNVGLLFIFKYLGFFLSNVGALLQKPILHVEIALPIGISFFTFQILSYIFDVYYHKAEVQKNVLNVGLYISMFPQLIAGPIVRYETVADEIAHREETSLDFTQGVVRFVYGLGKKVILSNYLAIIADTIFNGLSISAYSMATTWLGAIAYTLQIYFDFSGYSDMAIGLGRMFGFHYAENFNYPYIAGSVTDFWKRWHISLSTWFRDYVYIPLGGNRNGKKRQIFNLFVVWLLTGIWHGANWTFILWGLIYFLLLLIEKISGWPRKVSIVSHIYTIFFVILAWVVFRADSLTMAFQYLSNMFGIGISALVDTQFFNLIWQGKWILLLAVLFSFPIVPWLGERTKNLKLFKESIQAASMLLIFLVSVLFIVKATYNPFIYFNF